MELTINGESKKIGCTTISELLLALDVDPRRVAVELNLEIVPKPAYESTHLCSGDRIEIVQFVGGG